MSYGIKKSKYAKSSEDTLRFSYMYLNDEARERGWDSFEQAPEKEKKKIIKKVANKYAYSFHRVRD
jgi:hypothetical protein